MHFLLPFIQFFALSSHRHDCSELKFQQPVSLPMNAVYVCPLLLSLFQGHVLSRHVRYVTYVPYSAYLLVQSLIASSILSHSFR